MGAEEIGALRMRQAVMICAAGWGLFMLESLLRGNYRSVEITAVVTVCTALLWGLSRSTSDAARLVNLVRTNIVVASVGLLACAVTHGYSHSPAAWLIGLLPLFSACYLSMKDTVICASVGAGLILLISALESAHPIAMEFEFTGSRLAFAQLLNLGLVMGLALNVNHTHQAQLRKLREQAEAAVEGGEVKKRFLANMSHEFRTPLNGILGMADLLQATRLDAQQRHWLELLGTSGRLLQTVLQDVLEFADLENGALKPLEVEFELEDAVMDVIELFHGEARQKGIELAAVISPRAAGRWRGDRMRLSRILLNLVSNGVKFTEQGQVAVRVERCPEGLLFQVIDSGLGLAEEQRQRLFHPFYQAEHGTTRRHGGLGLGLAISQRLAGSMQSEIEVECPAEGGSIFRFRLALVCTSPATELKARGSLEFCGLSPLMVESLTATLANIALNDALIAQAGADEAAAIAAGSRARHKFLLTHPDQVELRQRAGELGYDTGLLQPLRSAQLVAWLGGSPRIDTAHMTFPLHVLVTEDNAVNRRVLCSMLEAVGVKTWVAETGAAALELARKEPFDLIFMDLHMPVMDGVEATRLIRQTAEHQPRIVAVTADAMSDAYHAMARAGADGFLTKPVERHQVYQVLRDLSRR